MKENLAHSIAFDPIITVGGFVPLSTVDYPEHLAAVIFTQGCSLRCAYCHNQDLQPVIPLKTRDAVSFELIFHKLKTRKGLLDAVVFSGGEPLVQSGIVDAIIAIKDLGYKIGLHTSGVNPKRLKECLPFLDWVGLDMKHRFSEYERVTKSFKSGEKAMESLKILADSNVNYEIRTTCDPMLLKKEDIIEIAKELVELNIKNYTLQEYRPIGRIIESPKEEIQAFFKDSSFIKQLNDMFENFKVRAFSD